jgi:hypothetical protein
VKTGATAPVTPSDTNPFTVFAWLWAAGIISHMASYSEPLELVTVVMFVLAFAVVFGVYRTGAFFLLLAVHVIYVYIRLPRVPNHSVIAAAVDLTILGAALISASSTRNWRIDTTGLYKTFAPVVRIELLIVYFFVVFHKLNSGFFNPEHSCGSFMYLRLAHEYPVLPTGDWFRPWAIYLTMLAETAIPVMLVVRRWRLAGVLVAFAFHFALAMDPGDVVFNFSAILVAFFFLFLPDDFAAPLAATLNELRHRVHGVLRVSPGVLKGVLLAVVAPLLAVLIFRDAIATGLTFEASRIAWVVYAGAVLSIFVVTLRRHGVAFPSARELLTVRTPGLLIIPVLLFANGVLPYLGLKTETSFAMYSNLRTEGGYSNHWLMPASLQIWDYQRDLVKIHRTSVSRIQRLVNRGYQWTYYEFKWLMHEHPNASVVYERNGVVRRVRRVHQDPELAPDIGVARKFLRFRPVAGDPARTPCIH